MGFGKRYKQLWRLLMPSGVYIRKPSKLRDEAIAKNFAKGHTKESREKALQSIQQTWTEEKREATSIRTQAIMRTPKVREKHLEALKNNPCNFRGGNGQPLTEVVKMAQELLAPLGFIRECPVSTKGIITNFPVPGTYRVDFGHPGRKIAIELDGVSHLSSLERKRDIKKTAILHMVKWKVIRIKHGKEVNQSQLS